MDAARRLVVHNLRLVVAIAYQYRRAWANILDLFQEGSVGLMEAVKRWEPSLGPALRHPMPRTGSGPMCSSS